MLRYLKSDYYLNRLNFTASALEYTNGNNVNFLDFIKNLIISTDRVPKISMDIHEDEDDEDDSVRY